MTKPKKRTSVFLACPIGDEGTDTRKHADQVRAHLVDEAISGLTQRDEIDVVRADGIARSGKITTQVIQQLIDCDVVIADLTMLNPNVLYELGVRQALVRPYILIASAGTQLPFDLKDSRTIFYDIQSLDSVKSAKQSLREHLEEALKGIVDPYDRQLFGETKQTREVLDLRLFETLGSVVEADRKTSSAVDALSRRLTDAIIQIETIFANSYGGAGSYLYISGEREAFSALVAAVSRAKRSVKTTRYSPYAVGGRQTAFAEMIRNRVLGLEGYQPLGEFFRIVAANNPKKIEDINGYLDEFIGKSFTLYLTPNSNNFELVIIDDEEVFVHFHGRDKIIDSTLHIIGPRVASQFGAIYTSLHDPHAQDEDVVKYDFKYMRHPDRKRIQEEIREYFQNHSAADVGTSSIAPV